MKKLELKQASNYPSTGEKKVFRKKRKKQKYRQKSTTKLKRQNNFAFVDDTKCNKQTSSKNFFRSKEVNTYQQIKCI